MNKIKTLFEFLVKIYLVSCLTSIASCQHTVVHDVFDVEVYLDPYKNYHIRGEDLPSNQTFESQVKAFKERYPGTALYIDQNPSRGVDSEHLLTLGFEFAEYDYIKNKILWILDNGRGVTHIGSGVSGAGVIVRNKAEEILLILNPDTKTWVLPSGGTDRGELIREGAIRELEEEVGLNADYEDLQLMAITNSTSAMGRPGLNSINFFYLLEVYSGEAKTSKEAPEIVWVHPSVLRGKTVLNGNKLHPFTPLFIEVLTDKTYKYLKTVRKGFLDMVLTN